MPGFEFTSPPSPLWTDMSRNLVATAATPLDLPADRLNDLLVLTTQVVSTRLNAPDVEEFGVSVETDSEGIQVEVTTKGGTTPGSDRMSVIALGVLSESHWTRSLDGRNTVGFTFTA